ncbi:MAG TPA: hypothetical protein VI138_04935, partial [Candidatus Dormibacteraeota bacterium]
GAGHAPGPGGTLGVQVTGEGGVPASGVGAVVVNVTITDPTTAGYISVFPEGVARPVVSTLDFSPGESRANLAEVAVGDNGQIAVYNSAGTTQVVVDVEGWYDSSAPTSGAGLYHAMAPQRLVDTRAGAGTPYSGQMLEAGHSLTVQVAGVDGVPSSGAEAAVFNVTVVDSTAPSVLAVYPTGTSAPTASTINFSTGQIIANQDAVELGSGGKVTIYNFGPGATDVILDVAGWYTDGSAGASSGASFNVLIPTRVVDTRAGSGRPDAGDTLAADETFHSQFSGLNGIPSGSASGVVLNVTVTDTTANGYLAVFPDGQPLPATSEMDWALRGQTTENAVVVGLSGAGEADFSNQSLGRTDLIIDLSGWFGAE